MIKVKNTRLHNEIPVVEGKFILFMSRKKSDFDHKILRHGMSVHEIPIIISETAEIEDGELCLYRNGDGTGKLTSWLDPFIEASPGAKYKILALPEHISHETREEIKRGKLKNGDKVFVECEQIINDIGNDGFMFDESSVISSHSKIKLNKDNHINLFIDDQEENFEEQLYNMYHRMPKGKLKDHITKWFNVIPNKAQEKIWDDILKDHSSGLIRLPSGNYRPILEWLKENYNPPTKK